MILVIWFILCLLVAMIGSGRGQSGILVFFLSVVLSPLIGLIIVLLSKNLSKN